MKRWKVRKDLFGYNDDIKKKVVIRKMDVIKMFNYIMEDEDTDEIEDSKKLVLESLVSELEDEGVKK